MNNLIPNKTPNIILFSITVVSMSLLAFEISLTRLLSVILSYHYVYGITSLALLGSGIGAFAVHYAGKNEADANINIEQIYNRLIMQLGLASICMIVSVLAIIQIGRFFTGNILIFGLLLCTPFFWGGMFFSSVFRTLAVNGGRLYFSDLSGAALGCVLVVFSLNKLGDIASIMLFSCIISVTSIVFALIVKAGKKTLLFSCSSLLLLIALVSLNLNNSMLFEIPIGKNNEKEIYDSLNIFKGEIVETEKSAFGRSDLIRYESIPEHMDIFLDGTAGTPMYKFNGNIGKPNEEVEELKTFPGFFPFMFFSEEEKQNALIIGPGGGRDVLISLLGGVEEITAVEVNPDLVNIVNDYSGYNGGIYSSIENIELIIDEGRSFLRSGSDSNYDIIMLTLPRTNTSRSIEGYALTENYLFTTDSINEYLSRINPDGHLVVVANDDAEILRLLSLTISVFEEKGITAMRAMDSVYILGSIPNPVFVLKNGDFDKETSEKIYQAAITERGYNPATSYFPKLDGRKYSMSPILYNLANGGIDQKSLISMVEEVGYDIRPVTDNDPFFYKLTVGLPESIKIVLLSAVLLILIVCAAFMLSALDIVKTDKSDKKKSCHTLKGSFNFIAVFFMLGMGYMVMEISFIQKFILFLGKPVLSLTIILFSVLLGSGIGSFISSRFDTIYALKMISRSTIAIFILLLIYNFAFIPLLFRYFLGLEFMMRILISVIALLPLSIVMGMPFPLAIRELHELKMDQLVPWMWGINAVSSVFGSVTALVLAISFGFNQAVTVASLCYIAANLSVRFIRPAGQIG